MFVTSNKASDLYQYVKRKLDGKFSATEQRTMFNALLEKRVGATREQLLFPDQILLSESDLLYVRTAVHRLLADEPFQYILGTVWFCDLELACDPRALIPRPETEELVYWIAEQYTDLENPLVADLCTGSGCIALGLQHLLPAATVYATDWDEKAFELAQQNASALNLPVNLLRINALQTTYPWAENSFDCWVSNPPYIPESEKQLIAPNVLQHEPHQALFIPDSDPLLFYRQIGHAAHNYLKAGGKLFFEIHENYAEASSSLMTALGYTEVEIRHDLQQKPRMMSAKKP